MLEACLIAFYLPILVITPHQQLTGDGRQIRHPNIQKLKVWVLKTGNLKTLENVSGVTLNFFSRTQLMSFFSFLSHRFMLDVSHKLLAQGKDQLRFKTYQVKPPPISEIFKIIKLQILEGQQIKLLLNDRPVSNHTRLYNFSSTLSVNRV